MPGRIMEQEKEAYARGRMGIIAPSEEYDRFCFLIDAQDDAYMRYHAQQTKQRATASSGEVSLDAEDTSDDADDEF